MSAWSPRSFDNDEALDWLGDMVDEQDMYFIHNTLEIIAELPADEKAETWDCVCAVAAAEMVAAAHGKPCPELPALAKDWLESFEFAADPEAVALAIKAIARVASDSGLRDVWEEAGQGAQWLDCLADLKARLAA